jgi:hypothetical protein
MIHTVAVDWSGALQGERRKIWLAEAVGGRLVRLEAGRRREEVIQELVELRRRSPDLVVGLDFAFSFPAWFVRQKRCASAEAMWEVAAREGEQWLRRCEPPFWGRPGRTCQVPNERHTGARMSAFGSGASTRSRSSRSVGPERWAPGRSAGCRS